MDNNLNSDSSASDSEPAPERTPEPAARSSTRHLFPDSKLTADGFTDTASAGNGGVATAAGNGGAIAIGDINSGGNVGNALIDFFSNNGGDMVGVAVDSVRNVKGWADEHHVPYSDIVDIAAGILIADLKDKVKERKRRLKEAATLQRQGACHVDEEIKPYIEAKRVSITVVDQYERKALLVVYIDDTMVEPVVCKPGESCGGTAISDASGDYNLAFVN